MTTPAKINKANKELAKQINSICQADVVEYAYNHWKNGVNHVRQGIIYIKSFGAILRGDEGKYCNTFRAFTMEEFHEEINGFIECYPNNKDLLFVNMRLEQKNEHQQQPRKAKV